MSDFDLETFLPYRLAVAAGQVSRGFSARYRRRFGISTPEWRVVAHLSHAGPATVGEIHRRVDMDKSRVSRAAARLESEGLLTKTAHPNDGRIVVLALTDRGRAMMRELAQMAREYQGELLATLGSGAAEVTQGIERLIAATPEREET